MPRTDRAVTCSQASRRSDDVPPDGFFRAGVSPRTRTDGLGPLFLRWIARSAHLVDLSWWPRPWGTSAAFLFKQRGAVAVRRGRPTSASPARSACFRSRWWTVGWLVALGAWLLHVGALSLAPLSIRAVGPVRWPVFWRFSRALFGFISAVGNGLAWSSRRRVGVVGLTAPGTLSADSDLAP